MNLSPTLVESTTNNRRTSSGRAVKRKKFDDEIIECTNKKDKSKIASPSYLSNEDDEVFPVDIVTSSLDEVLAVLSIFNHSYNFY